MESLLKLSCDKFMASFSLWPYSYILDVRRDVQKISNLQDSDFQRSINDYIGVNFRKIVCSDQLLEFSKEDVTTFLSIQSRYCRGG